MTLLDLAIQAGATQPQQNAIKELLELDNKTTHLTRTQELLMWDQEVMMPSKGVGDRAEQLSTLEAIIHEYIVHPRVAELLHILEVTDENHLGATQFPSQIRGWLRAKYREWHKASSLPPALVQEIVRTRSNAHAVWVTARRNNDFNTFAPLLEKTITLQKERADCLGYQDSPYDALLQDFEPEIDSKTIETLFSELRDKLLPIYTHALEHQSPPEQAISVPIAQQEAFCKYIVEELGFTNEIGRMDTSAHPFSTQLGSQDARITIGLFENEPLSSVFSALHEAGHSLYELFVDPVFYRTVCGRGTSFGIHESQSRFLECIIGRSREFWIHYYSKLQSIMTPFSEISLDDFITRISRISPSLIRIEADELSYNMHIIIRFELEKALIEDSLNVQDLPDAWAEKYEKYLQIKPQTYSEGVLQDIHWSEGYFGYFPSYTLGNMYAAKLQSTLALEMPNYRTEVQQGNIQAILHWLHTTIHKHGASVLPAELVELSVDPLIEYLQSRYTNL